MTAVSRERQAAGTQYTVEVLGDPVHIRSLLDP
jgi:hypothetical protein